MDTTRRWFLGRSLGLAGSMLLTPFGVSRAGINPKEHPQLPAPGDDSAPKNASAKGGTVMKAITEHRLNHDGMQRRYLLELPPNNQEDRPAPLILFFHGGGGTADRLAGKMDFHRFPEGQAYVIAHPDGHKGSFNAGPGPDGKSPNWGAAFEANLDDVGFASAIIDDVCSRVCIDTRRVYASGWSNGSAMSFRLACELSDRIAAVAGCFSEISLQAPMLSRPVPMLYCYGTADPIRRPGSPMKDDMAARCIGTLIRLNGCRPEPAKVSQLANATMTRWEGDHPDAVVIQWRLDGHGHFWPGLQVRRANREYITRMFGPLSSDISATEEALSLFARHLIP